MVDEPIPKNYFDELDEEESISYEPLIKEADPELERLLNEEHEIEYGLYDLYNELYTKFVYDDSVSAEEIGRLANEIIKKYEEVNEKTKLSLKPPMFVKILADLQLEGSEPVAHRLIKAGKASMVFDAKSRFPDLEYNVDLAKELIETDQFGVYLAHVVQFDKSGQDEFFDAILEKRVGAAWLGRGIQNLDYFDKVDKKELANRLYEQGAMVDMVSNFDKFEGVDQLEFAEKFLEAGYDTLLAKNIDKFPNVGPDIVEQLIFNSPIEIIQNYHGEYSEDMIYDVVKFSQHNSDIADAVFENLYNFPAFYHFVLLEAAAGNYSTAQKILKSNVLNSLYKDQKDEILKQISQLKPEHIGVRNDNPYQSQSIENVPSGVEGQNFYAKEANEVCQLLKEPLKAGEDREWYQLVSDEILGGYEMLTQKIEELGKDYPNSEEIFGYGKDKIIRDFYPTYQRLVAEYLVLMNLSPHSNDNIHATYLVDQALQNANEKFVQVLKIDTQYYDHLYREWDNKREGNLDFEEVFLGRDGVYAYVGRVGQILARRAAIRLRGQQLSESEKQLLQMPTYMIYPRGFRDSLHQETKAAFINQELRNPDNASFYDTGFTGTIPQDIMDILGIPRSEWDRRTRLLSATARERTVTGLKGSKSERDEIVNTIEYNVKPTESAEGLFARQLPGESDERLVPYAQPTNPAERLAFRMVQQALYRHYFVKESKRLASREHVLGVADRQITRADGADVHLRVDQGLDATSIGALRDLFGSTDLGADLAEQAEAIKIASPEDPFPNEAVYELNLATNTGARAVIVKAIVPEKSHGPLDEYAALRLLDSLGIESAKPLARVFLPGDEGAGFVVMDKLPGVSGRNLRRTLENEGLSDNTIDNIEDIAFIAMNRIARIVKTDVGLDKPWRLKDFMVVLENDSEGRPFVDKLIPIDFERVRVYDPNNPCEIKL